MKHDIKLILLAFLSGAVFAFVLSLYTDKPRCYSFGEYEARGDAVMRREYPVDCDDWWSMFQAGLRAGDNMFERGI